jgi:hypothetical protein
VKGAEIGRFLKKRIGPLKKKKIEATTNTTKGSD